MSTFQQKLMISLGSAALFTVINLPQTYRLTDSILPLDLYNSNTNCPTSVGLIIHAIVFFVFTFLSMKRADVRSGIKLKHSIYGTLIFFLVASPAMYSVVGSLLGNQFADTNGCPTTMGILLHAAVYCAALVGVMYLPEGNK